MKFLLVGHACWWVESQGARILFDPLLFDPNQADCYEVHPTRRVDVPALCRSVNAIVISHRHIDHFDIHSLGALPRTATVLCPCDTLIVDALHAMGYWDVRPMTEWSAVRIGDTTLTATSSMNAVPELGFVVSDQDGSVWNQIDTQIDATCRERVARSFGRSSAVICPWQPLMELKFQLHDSTAFPHRDYYELLLRARACDADVLVPGACGFRYTERARWSNRLAFPVTRARFIRDLAAGGSRQVPRALAMDPGDELDIARGVATLHRQARTEVRSETGEEGRVAFLPVDPFRDLYEGQALVSAAEVGLEEEVDDLDRFLQGPAARVAVRVLRDWQVTARLIVCAESAACAVHWDFKQGATRVDGDCALATATTIVSARVLRSLYRGQCSWEDAFHSGEWRYFQTAARVTRQAYWVPEPSDIADVMALRYPYDACYMSQVTREVNRWSGVRGY